MQRYLIIVDNYIRIVMYYVYILYIADLCNLNLC